MKNAQISGNTAEEYYVIRIVHQGGTALPSTVMYVLINFSKVFLLREKIRKGKEDETKVEKEEEFFL